MCLTFSMYAHTLYCVCLMQLIHEDECLTCKTAPQALLDDQLLVFSLFLCSYLNLSVIFRILIHFYLHADEV